MVWMEQQTVDAIARVLRRVVTAGVRCVRSCAGGTPRRPVTVTLLAAKTKGAPVKQQSISRVCSLSRASTTSFLQVPHTPIISLIAPALTPRPAKSVPLCPKIIISSLSRVAPCLLSFSLSILWLLFLLLCRNCGAIFFFKELKTLRIRRGGQSMSKSTITGYNLQ